MMSASSVIPRLMPCSSSPAPGAMRRTNVSTTASTTVSDWPTPTVSTSTVSKPAASQTRSASRVRRATPPSAPPEGEGRTNASGWRDSSSMRVLSPRMDPPERGLDGSTARTATLWPRSMRWSPNASMNVDLPAPGAPLIPIRAAPPVRGISSSSSSLAATRSAARLDSTNVIARANALRSPPTSVCSVLTSLFAKSAPSEGPVGGTVTPQIHSRWMAYRWFDDLLLELAVAQHGAISTTQVLDRGGTHQLLAARCRSGRIRRIRIGLYVHTGFPPSWQQDLWLEHLAPPRTSAV